MTDITVSVPVDTSEVKDWAEQFADAGKYGLAAVLYAFLDRPEPVEPTVDAQMEHDLAEAVQKGAESNAETPNPADVKPGEPWVVDTKFYGRGIALRNPHPNPGDWLVEESPWVFCSTEQQDRLSDEGITLLHRLVPAPRIITNPDELDHLAATSIIRDGRGWPGGVTDQGVIMINGFCLSDEDVLARGPVTVLWEPGA